MLPKSNRLMNVQKKDTLVFTEVITNPLVLIMHTMGTVIVWGIALVCIWPINSEKNCKKIMKKDDTTVMQSHSDGNSFSKNLYHKMKICVDFGGVCVSKAEEYENDHKEKKVEINIPG